MSDLIKRILVPTDFSECSEAATTTASSLAKKFQCKVVLMHVVDIPGYAGFKLKEDIHGTTLEEIATNAAMERLKRIKLSKEFKGINLEIKVRIGRIYRTILEESQDACDLIIMGTHGTTGIGKLLLGSNTQKVVNLSTVPVLSLKDPMKVEDIHNIVFASTFDQEFTLTFPSLYQFMEAFEAKLHMLKVITPSGFESTEYSRRIIHDFAASFYLKDYEVNIVNAFTIEEGLDWFCQEEHMDLIFMATHGRHSISRLIKGSHSEKMGQKYSCPVFSIRMLKPKIHKGVIFPD